MPFSYQLQLLLKTGDPECLSVNWGKVGEETPQKNSNHRTEIPKQKAIGINTRTTAMVGLFHFDVNFKAVLLLASVHPVVNNTSCNVSLPKRNEHNSSITHTTSISNIKTDEDAVNFTFAEKLHYPMKTGTSYCLLKRATDNFVCCSDKQNDLQTSWIFINLALRVLTAQQVHIC